MLNKIIIAIDGTSSTGKSTLAKRLAKKLKYLYIDSGAMYRALTLYAIQKKYISKSHFASQKLIEDIPNIHIDFQYNQQNNKYEVHLNNNSVEKHIRSLKVSNLVSQIATVGELRKHMVKVQHFLGSKNGVIMDGRDIGTVVFPNADFKFFFTAKPEVRARRRWEEMKADGYSLSYNEVLKNILYRDKTDTERKVSPLKKATDAIKIDTTNLSLDQAFEILVAKINCK